MRSNLKITAFLSLFFTTMAWAQDLVELKDLKTPNSPAFQILDIAPNIIERPTNPKEFSASLMSLSNNGSVIPKNFAMEFSPFWALDKKTTINDYLNLGDKNSSSKNYFIQTGLFNKMTLSLASVYSDSTSASLLKKTNYIAFGVRTNLITIRTKTQSDEIVDYLDKYHKRVKELNKNKDEVDNILFLKRNNYISKKRMQLLIDKLKLEEPKDNKQIDILENEVNKLDSISEKINNKEKLYAQESVDELSKKMEKDPLIKECYIKFKELPLVQLDAAYAYSDALPDNDSQKKRFNRSGFWLNGALNLKGIDEKKLNDNLIIMLSVRFLSDNILDTSTTDIFKRQNFFDWGYKFEYSLEKLSIAIEHLTRKYSTDTNLNSERTTAVLQYKISDGIYFTGSYGKNFGVVKNIFTLFGINYGFGKTQLKVID